MTEPTAEKKPPVRNSVNLGGWFVLVATAHRDAEEILCALAWEAGCAGIVTEDTITGPGSVDETLPEDSVRIKAYFRWDHAVSPEQLCGSLLDNFRHCCLNSGLPGLALSPVMTVEAIPEIDYHSIWRKFHRPISIASTWLLCPPWEIRHESARTTIILEPSMAFGTGQHESTQLILTFLKMTGLSSALKSVLDCGCGSGVLALAAAMVGAERLIAMDNDHDAVTICRNNCRLNHMEARVDCLTGSVECCREGSFSLVLANLQKEILDEIGVLLLSLLIPGGICCFSGLLHHEAAELADQYHHRGYQRIWEETSGEWQSFAVRKNSSS